MGKSVFWFFPNLICYLFQKCKKFLWNEFVEAFYVPAYRYEWGNYRKWTVEKNEWKKSELYKRIKQIRLKIKDAIDEDECLNTSKTSSASESDEKFHLGCKRIVINVSGVIFQTQERTLGIFPESLLGNPNTRDRFWNPERQEYYFDRPPECFESILHFYQTKGTRLERPFQVSTEEFWEELCFFNLHNFKTNEIRREVDDRTKVSQEDHHGMETISLLQRKLWLLMEAPSSSKPAQLLSKLSILVILLSTGIYCIETMPIFRGSSNRYLAVVDIRDPMFLSELICIMYFIFELTARFIASPSKFRFLKKATNIVDFAAVVPVLLEIWLWKTNGISVKIGNFTVHYVIFEKNSITETFHRFFRVVRIFRVFKLSRHSEGLQVLWQTLRASMHELALLGFFLSIGVVIFASSLFFIEGTYNEESSFTSIPGTFYWAVSAMTTTGFDSVDELPTTVLGKVIGSICALAGVLTTSLPVPVVVANFTYFYRRGLQQNSNQSKNPKRRRKIIRSCPYLPTCKQDDGKLHMNELFGKASKFAFEKRIEKYMREKFSVNDENSSNSSIATNEMTENTKPKKRRSSVLPV